MYTRTLQRKNTYFLLNLLHTSHVLTPRDLLFLDIHLELLILTIIAIPVAANPGKRTSMRTVSEATGFALFNSFTKMSLKIISNYFLFLKRGLKGTSEFSMFLWYAFKPCCFSSKKRLCSCCVSKPTYYQWPLNIIKILIMWGQYNCHFHAFTEHDIYCSFGQQWSELKESINRPWHEPKLLKCLVKNYRIQSL